MEQRIEIIHMETASEKPRPPLRFTRREWLTLAGTAALAAGFVYGWLLAGEWRHLPGLGLALSAWLLLGLCLLRTDAKRLRRALFPLLAAALLALCYAVYADDALRLMNLPVLTGLVAAAAYALAGAEDPLGARALATALTRPFADALRHWAAPLHALAGLRAGGDHGHLRALLLGLMLCAPVAGAAALLLCDADATFAHALSGLLRGFHAEHLPAALCKLGLTLPLALLLFGFLYGLARQPQPKITQRRFTPGALTLGVVLVALCALYATFLYVQFDSLRVLPASYARNARAGFFQLVLVALLTLLVTLPALSLRPDSLPLRLLAALVTLLTGGILASAAWRMALYIGAYGWTLLRMVTLWGILAIAAALLAALVKCIRPRVRICRGLAIFTIVTWLAFNCMNVDARISNLNVAAHRSGALEALDVDYLTHLSPDVLPALRALAKAEPQYAPALHEAEEAFRAAAPRAYDWALCWRKLDAK